MSKSVLTAYTVKTEYPMSAPVTIAHLSDIHSRKADDILEMVKNVVPDIIVISGDTLERYDNRPQYDYNEGERFHPLKWLILHILHYTNYFLEFFIPQQKKSSTKNAYDLLRSLTVIAPVYLSLGNHEQALDEEDYRFFDDAGIILLDNAYRRININGFSFYLGGMSSFEFEVFLKDFSKLTGYKILLCHHPERFEPFIEKTDIDLTLSGHTHGGQIRVGKKGRGFFVPGQGLFKKYAHGRFFGGRLIVSAGCSNTVVCPRLFNPRELVVLHLTGV